MSKFTNTQCTWIGFNGRCSNVPWSLPTGLRVDTPYCETHSRLWSAARATDLEVRY